MNDWWESWADNIREKMQHDDPQEKAVANLALDFAVAFGRTVERIAVALEKRNG